VAFTNADGGFPQARDDVLRLEQLVIGEHGRGHGGAPEREDWGQSPGGGWALRGTVELHVCGKLEKRHPVKNCGLSTKTLQAPPPAITRR
jgi:hypothetical protein